MTLRTYGLEDPNMQEAGQVQKFPGYTNMLRSSCFFQSSNIGWGGDIESIVRRFQFQFDVKVRCIPSKNGFSTRLHFPIRNAPAFLTTIFL